MDKIAIIGVSCLFPDADSPDQFWNNLIEGKASTSEATPEQMGVDPAVFFHPEKGQADKYYCLQGGFIQGFQFDPTGFSLSAESLEELDDGFHWSLQVSKDALEDSGYLHQSDALSRCGIALGNLSFPTKRTRRAFGDLYRNALNPALRELLNNDDFELESLPGDGGNHLNARISDYPASVIAQAFSLGAPTLALDAACASSLYAVDMASRYLRLGKADLMLAGAVSCADPLFIHQGFSIFHAYPETGQSRPLDKSSEGLIAAEGAGMFVLKRYQDARRDGDRIYAIIQGTGLSNDGRGKSVLNPDPSGQILAFERAYTEVDPATVDYVECHATGTPVGDPAELEAMETFWTNGKRPRIGSIKSNLGHMLSAAGMGSMLKVILSMDRGQIPPTIHVTDPQESENGFGPDHIVTLPTAWPEKEGEKRAGVSAFGFGGTNAHIILDSDSDPTRPKMPTSAFSETLPRMAIVGMDAVFGGCKNLEAFGSSIYHGIQHFGPLPSQRWKGIEENRQLLETYGFEAGKAPEGAYLSDLDIDFLNIKTPPGETDQLIPQQLLMLNTADTAVRDAGLKSGGRVGVIVAMGAELAIHAYLGRCDLTWQIRSSLADAGISLTPEQVSQLEAIAKDSLHDRAQVNQYTSFIGNIMAGRIAALWDFSGPAFTLSAGEASVPRALEIAQMLLHEGEVEAIIVGAVDLSAGIEHMLVQIQRSPSNNGKHTLSYDRHVTGWTPGEGAGAVVLKRLDSAQKDHDRIYASIDAVALARSPSGSLEKDVYQACEQALEIANLAKTDIGFIEVSASGIEGEDTAEIGGLTRFYGQADSSPNCALGSVKSNVGHTFAASGMASLIKTVLCLTHRYLPGTSDWSAPGANWNDVPFFVPARSQPWFTTAGTPNRTAAVNLLSGDGTTAHMVLSEYRESTRSVSALRPSVHLFPIVGQSQKDLLDQLNHLQQGLQATANLSLTASRCYEESQKQAEPPFALSLVSGGLEQLRQEIESAREGVVQAFETGKSWTSRQGSYFTAEPLGAEGKTAFVYPGSANAYIGMGQNLWQYFPQAWDDISQISAQIGERMCEREIYPRSLEALSADQLRQREAELAENAVCMFQTGVGFAALNTHIIRDEFQVRPHMAFGYSLGESSMLFSLGAWKDPDIISEAMNTLPVFSEQLFGPKTAIREAWNLPPDVQTDTFWSTFALQANVDEVKACLEKENRVYLTMINTPDEVIIAGDPAGCERVVQTLGCTGIRLPFNGVLHCSAVDMIYDSFVKLHTLQVHETPEIDFYSAIDCAPVQLESAALAHNMGKTISNCVDFPRIVNKVYQDNARIFIDLGPRGTAASWIDRILNDRSHIAVTVDRKGRDSFSIILRSLAKLFSHRVEMDIASLYDLSGEKTQKTLVQTVKLGGKRIHSAILANKEIFSNPQQAQPFSGREQPFLVPAEQIQTASGAPVLQAQARELSDWTTFADQTFSQSRSHVSQSHSSFLAMRAESLQQIGEMIGRQTETFTQAMGQALSPSVTPAVQGLDDPAHIVWNEADLLEFAEGDIANVFGAEYEVIDKYSRRVRLPLPPYLLVSRVTELTGERGVFKPSAITTEYDIPKNAPYSVDGQISWAVAVESGQCDLLLISYLGIDFESKGERIYRLLDCTLTFLDDLPREGETLRYDISINSFSRSGDSLLFFFSYECFVKDRMILKMDGGCAGFFTDAELDQGKGVIFTEAELAKKKAQKKRSFDPPLTCAKTAFSRQDLLHLVNSDPSACFGESHDQNGRNTSLRLPSESMLMIDRIVSVNPQGGSLGLGELIAEKDLAPDHWYFPCHFKDDQVLAGSLIGEACAQSLQFYLLYLGLQTHTEDARFQPIPDLPQVVRCRGQVVPSDTLITYRMEITEIGLSPHPYAIADVEVILDEKTIVHFKDLGVQLSDKTGSLPGGEVTPKAALIDENQIREFAQGSISKCFGPDFQVYDTKRAPRTPNGDLQLISRILNVHGERGDLSPGSHLVAEYDVPADPWFYRQNPYPSLPYSIAMELGLQPCGFLSAYLGSTLPYPDVDFYFRNLDGKGHLERDIDVRGKTISNRVELLSSTSLEGVIIQKFSYEMSVDDQPFFHGDAAFGYFTAHALTDQVGLDSGKHEPSWLDSEGIQGEEINLNENEGDRPLHLSQSGRPHFRLASEQLHFLDKITTIPNGGRYGQGYVFARKQVNPGDWFYVCHFYQDPVMPGSLGVEAILQAMQAYAIQQDVGERFNSPHFSMVPNHQTVWKYRGQIVTTDSEITLEAHIKEIRQTDQHDILIADANLWKEGLRIYEVQDVAIGISETK